MRQKASTPSNKINASAVKGVINDRILSSESVYGPMKNSKPNA
jgi:hypothetical protein